MAVLEGGTPLVCKKCDQPFPVIAQFCTSCGATRAIALGHELDPEEKAKREQEEIARKAAEAREVEKEKLRLEAERKKEVELRREQKKIARKEFLVRNTFKIRIGAALTVVLGVYVGFQTAIYAQTSPETIVYDYVSAVVEKNPESLKNTNLFPVKFSSYEIAPPEILDGINSKVVEPDAITTNWSAWSSNATVDLGDWGYSIRLVSEDRWNFIFREHVWRVESNAPMLKVTSGTGISSYLHAVSLGDVQETPDFTVSAAAKPVKYVMWPGSFYIKSQGKGFVGDWSESVNLKPDVESKVMVQVGDYSVNSNALSLASQRVRNQFNTCFKRNGCGEYFSMADFDIEYPWYYENYWIDDTYTVGGCVYSSETVNSATTATVYYNCDGTISRSVTWLIAEYYFWADEWDWDWGTTYPSYTLQANLRYDEKTNRFLVTRVSKV